MDTFARENCSKIKCLESFVKCREFSPQMSPRPHINNFIVRMKNYVQLMR